MNVFNSKILSEIIKFVTDPSKAAYKVNFIFAVNDGNLEKIGDTSALVGHQFDSTAPFKVLGSRFS